MDIILLILFLFITYQIGSTIEKNHLKKIKKREIKLINKPVISFGSKTYGYNTKIKKVQLVTGEAAIGADFFMSFVAGLKTLFGGHLNTFESVLERARREAIVRMREKAAAFGADAVINTRIETITLNNIYIKHNKVAKCAVIAYGTAITYKK